MKDNQTDLNTSGQIIFKTEFDMVLKVSTNVIYAGVHWRKRKSHKDMYRWEVMRVVKAMKIKPVKTYPSYLKFTFYFDKNLLDSSNCSYMAKLIEDSLVHEKIFVNDTPQYVSVVSNESKRGDKGKNKIVLEVFHDTKNDDKRDSETVCGDNESRYPHKGQTTFL